jgi:hypothetical protein
MSFWRDLLSDIKAMAVLHDDVRRMEQRIDKLDTTVSRQGERLAYIEGLIGFVQSQPRLPN